MKGCREIEISGYLDCGERGMATRLLTLSIIFVGTLPPNILCRYIYSYNIINDYSNLILTVPVIHLTLYLCVMVGPFPYESTWLWSASVQQRLSRRDHTYFEYTYYSIIQYNIGLIRVRVMCMLSCCALFLVAFASGVAYDNIRVAKLEVSYIHIDDTTIVHACAVHHIIQWVWLTFVHAHVVSHAPILPEVGSGDLDSRLDSLLTFLTVCEGSLADSNP